MLHITLRFDQKAKFDMNIDIRLVGVAIVMAYTWVELLFRLGFCVDGIWTLTLGIHPSGYPYYQLKLSHCGRLGSSRSPSHSSGNSSF